MASSAEATVIQGDCVEVMREMDENSLDAVVCDPPAGISFMGKSWDSDRGSRNAWIAWLTEVMEEAYRVMKPGAHGFVWALPRTSHWTGMALEDAGFEIRDRVAHHFGSGFPKSANVSKHIDRMAGAEREVVGTRTGRSATPQNDIRGGNLTNGKSSGHNGAAITAPATQAAKQWDGWGTALKPSTEDWWLIRKPLSESSVARNVLKHGTGAINVDGCRVGTEQVTTHSRGKNEAYPKRPGEETVAESGRTVSQNGIDPTPRTGRWPSNLILSHSPGCQPTGERRRIRVPNLGRDWSKGKEHGTGDGATYLAKKPTGKQYADPDGFEELEGWECVGPGCPIWEMDRQSGESKSSGGAGGSWGKASGTHEGWKRPSHENYIVPAKGTYPADSGGASRFFPNFTPDTGAGFLYQAKASRAERNKGLEGMPEREHQTHNHVGRDMSKPTNAMGEGERKRVERGEVAMRPSANSHPTVKPLMLMDWLVTLITPPGGTVLDPFAGSGSTGCSAVRLGFNFIGIEKEEEYAEIARRRIEYWSQPEEAKEKKNGAASLAPPQSPNAVVARLF